MKTNKTKYLILFLVIASALIAIPLIKPIYVAWSNSLLSAVPLIENSNTKACNTHLKDKHSNDPSIFARELAREQEEYMSLIEKSLVYRTESIKSANQLKQKINQGTVFSGNDLDILNEGMLAHLALRKDLYKVAEIHECWLDKSFNVSDSPEINSELRLQGIMLSLSAALILYDNYLLAISIFEEDTKLRRFLNERDTGYNIGRSELAKVTLSYNSAINRQRVRTALTFYEDKINNVSVTFLNDYHNAYIYQVISQSPSYNMTKEFSPLIVIGLKLNFLGSISGDVLSHIGSEGISLFSMLFGNSVGLIESRKGKLYADNISIKDINNKLHAGDILLEKTPFRLTDSFIPGHWGHAAIWIGTEEELKTLNIWDHPLVKPYQEQIRSGKSVIEALRAGVVINTLDHFMNVDDVGVFRKRGEDIMATRKIILRTFRQLGKAYDFNFDVETSDKIVCSELVYITYTDIKWPTENTLGRATISPDNIASKAMNNGPLDMISFYHDGSVVTETPIEKMRSLMEL